MMEEWRNCTLERQEEYREVRGRAGDQVGWQGKK